ncbi:MULTISPECIES: circularly permuted type 2 ATP-grasp protein [unclassified Pseudomonas]|uniref:circularly permuted type 2 ATP-grasp protein n=1 Tax=unclassified Pseudomonas TaxID=196821 RepID=UPI001198F37B|nr:MULTISPECIES: circularly permuted type 2 ATP-grasp protein [unclassified Pseudomonas]TWC15840.1 putative circularly permuted ATP-grasp superfamily protein [Pseudomonas sp. SJZ075]TWC24056.1 putative circularly permuted ATP-grasp superfamily protein [Pseudomonas sp. SJZ074]TWC31838.1 putative circularly permuted ATP-grasp superfamily protein [Pseudomonas sp. SJZ078]TWC41795.1 putative circularly permuted ATP-grasp superfamily protein [Pseudomonas sp. SJZ085]TWC50306.1 putative circularly per
MPDLLDRYPLTTGTYHELLDDHGAVRPHWRRLFDQLQRSTPAQLMQRQALLARQIQENGVTYNVYADPKGADRPWELDLLPHVIDAQEWKQLSAGIAQRARLLNAVLADLYGPQRLISEGLLPAELVFGHNNFLWPCQGISPPEGIFLHLYAVDLARTPDGRWWVTADRTQAPSGAGYALENRMIVSRAFPDLYRDLKVQHLSGFFRTLQETLARQAPSEGEPPLVVLLTPGRFNESYFEHLYLARQLGYPLVEGGDLTVRDATVYLKTLSGLRRVHAIMRRLDDDFCDPLELRTDSALGVPGLLEAVRQGRVLVGNALGSGVLESPGLLGFLPKICQFLFGEDLLLPSIATWWCGEPPVLAQALEKLPQLLIRPAFPSQSFKPAFGRDLSEEQRDRLAARIQARPYAYVAQELAQLSQAPVWQAEDGLLQPRAIGMRVYAVSGKDDYRVLPGGLTRVAAEADAEVVSMQRGGASKDTWVLGELAPGSEQWKAQRTVGVHDLVRRDPYLPSRVVENLFWFGRYCERCDDSARLLRIMLARYVDGDDPQALQSAVSLGESLMLLPEEGELPERLLAALLGDDWSFSLRSNLQRLQWAASQVRGKLSRENWQALVELQREALELETGEADFGELLDFLNRLVMSLAALSGFALDDMTRDEGWRFLMIGRRLERLQFLSSSLAAFLRGEAVFDQAGLEWLLELGNSSITYRSRYLAVAQLIPVLDLLLLDEQNPHAVLFQLKLVARTLKRLNDDFGAPRETALPELVTRLSRFDLRCLENPLFGEASLRAALDGLADLLQEVADVSGQVSDRLALRHFAHVDDVSQRTVSV